MLSSVTGIDYLKLIIYDLEALENGIASYVGAANLRTAWQQAAISKKSSYSDAFPLVTLSKRMRAAVTLRSDTNSSTTPAQLLRNSLSTRLHHALR